MENCNSMDADRIQIGNEIFEFGRKIGERNLVAMLNEKIVPTNVVYGKLLSNLKTLSLFRY